MNEKSALGEVHFIALFFLFEAFVARAVEVKGVVGYTEIHQAACSFLYFLNTWVAKLNYLSAFGAYEVIVLATLVCFFELSHVFPELMLGHQSAFKQQLNGVV